MAYCQARVNMYRMFRRLRANGNDIQRRVRGMVVRAKRRDDKLGQTCLGRCTVRLLDAMRCECQLQAGSISVIISVSIIVSVSR